MGVTGVVLDYAVAYLMLMLPMVLLTGPLSGGVAILQAYGTTHPVMISGIVRSGLNIILDWILIFGHLGMPKMGIQGAALATTIAEIIGTIVLFVMILKPGVIPFRITWKKTLKAPLSLYGKVFRKGDAFGRRRTSLEYGEYRSYKAAEHHQHDGGGNLYNDIQYRDSSGSAVFGHRSGGF